MLQRSCEGGCRGTGDGLQERNLHNCYLAAKPTAGIIRATMAARTPPGRPGPPGLVLDFEDTFREPVLDERYWLPAYLPQWSSRTQAAARYTVGGGELRLRIDPDQPPWCPEFDGSVRVSSLQTGVFAGPLGSGIGQHRFSPRAVVREAQAERRLYTPAGGRIEIECRATDDPDAMVALWMIGFEDRPERSGELCVCEIFGRDVTPSGVLVGMGIHPFGDPSLVDEFAQEPVAFDAREFHAYAVDWGDGRSTFSIDGRVVRTLEQAPAYPLQLMLSLYRFERPAGVPPRPRGLPSPEFVVRSVRGWRRAAD